MTAKSKNLVFLAALILFAATGRTSYSDHTVLVEGCSSSTCPHCAIASDEIYSIHEGGSHDFCYVALVANYNSHAMNRCSELGVQFIPDYVFDGGYERWVGSGGLPDAYTSRISASAGRPVADIDLELRVLWEAEALLRVYVTITNHEGGAYQGRLRIYITEIESRWKTTSGQPFHFAMIGDFAANQDVSIPAGEAKELSDLWDGLFQGFGDIQKENIMVVGALFNGTSGFVDKTAGATISDNKQPAPPGSPGGMTNLLFGTESTYSTDTEDPEEDLVFYLWEWGDGTTSEWTGPCDSGETVTNAHEWTEPGSYQVRVRARDVSGQESDWSDPITVTAVQRGDANGDLAVDFPDAITILFNLFQGNPVHCQEAANVNGDGARDLTDAIYLLTYLFLGGPPPPEPF